MKPFFLIALLGLMPLGPTLPVAAQTLRDPGFETPGQMLTSQSDAPSGKAQISGAIADGWQDNTNWADVQIAYALDPDHPHGGQFSQKIVVTRGFVQFTQPVAFQSKRYRVTVSMRAQPAQWVSLTLRQGGAPYAVYATTPAKIGPQWAPVTVEGETPAVDGGLYVNTTGPGTLWLDDAHLTVTPPPGPLTLSPSPLPIPRTYFGLNVNHMHDSPGFDWPALDFGTFRTWDSGDVWENFEPQRGVFHWDNLDKDVAQAQAHHEEVLFTFGGTPRWATSAPDSDNSYVGFRVVPDHIADWQNAVTALVTRYRGRIRAYEVWNEPDGNGFYEGTPAQLVPLERSAAEIIHRIDPSALVLAPVPSSVAAVTSLKWVDDYLTAGGGRAADVMPYHDYDDTEEGTVQAIRNYRALLAQHGLSGKPLWLTEFGMDRPGRTQADAAAYIAHTFLIGRGAGLSRAFFYAYDNGPLYFSLDETSADGKTHDPSRLDSVGAAYRQLEYWITNARMLSCRRNADGVWVCALRRADGSRAWVVWRPAGPQIMVIPPFWKAQRVQDLTGKVSDQHGPLAVGPTPILVLPGA